MPWVRLDDRFPSNRKISLLSDRAFRLYVSALCWCSENLTEGKILDRELAHVTRVRGAQKTAAELEAAGLWDRTDGGWVVHDYLEYNPDRARVKADREANAARQKAYRERRRAEREAKRAAEETERNDTRNGVTPADSDAENDASATRQRHDSDTTATGTVPVSETAPQATAIRNAVSNGTPSRPVPSSVSPEGDTERKTASYAREIPFIGDRPRIPDASQPLVDKLTAAGMITTWDLQPNEWFLIEVLIKRCGIDALVATAHGMWENARKRPRNGNYYLPGWRKLPDIPEGTPTSPAPSTDLAAPGAKIAVSRQQQETDDWFARSMARAQAKDQAAQHNRETS